MDEVIIEDKSLNREILTFHRPYSIIVAIDGSVIRELVRSVTKI
jgi:hypothetical protein